MNDTPSAADDAGRESPSGLPNAPGHESAPGHQSPPGHESAPGHPGDDAPTPPASRPDDTRSALVAAARAVFAQRGYDGASVRAITSRADANLGAVTYHFGSKEGLYNEVVAGMMAPIRDRIAAVARRPSAPLDRLDDVVEVYFDHFAEHGDLPRFLMERIASGQLPPPPVVATMRTILRTVSGIIVEGQRDGSIRTGDPVLMTLSLVAQPVYLTLVKAPLAAAMDVDFAPALLVAHARRFVRAGLSSTHPAEAP